MDQICEIILKLKITELEAQLALREIERVRLNWQIDKPEIDEDERYRAIMRRERVLIEWGDVMTELQGLRDRHSRELTLMRRVEQN